MSRDQAMEEFVRVRRGRDRDEVFEDFLEAFLLDEEEGEEIFQRLWSGAQRPPAAPKPAPGGRPGGGRPGGGAGRAAGGGGQGPRFPTGGQNRRGAGDLDPDLLTAPYRFVALNERIVEPEAPVLEAWEHRELHDWPLPAGMTGCVEIAITFDGPMLIGESDGETDRPLRIGDTPVIPGATLRGLTRSVLEIAAHARLSQTNLHRRFSIRDFDHALFRDEDRRQVRAGWLRRVPGEVGERPQYQIEPCDWYRVRIRDLPGAAADPGRFHLDWLMRTDLAARYARFGMASRGGDGHEFDFARAARFSLVHSGEGGLGLLRPDPRGAVEGIYVFSDKSPAISPSGLDARDRVELKEAQKRRDDRRVDEFNIRALDHQDNPANARQGDAKKTEAVFAPSRGAAGAVLEVPRHVWDSFDANNSKPSRHKPRPAGNWAVLKPTLDAGHPIPVFWVADGDGAVSDLGLVRVFKRAHPHSLGQVLARTGRDAQGRGAHVLDLENFRPDFVEALFGHVHEPEADQASAAPEHLERHLKGRVRFGFAWLDGQTRGKLSAEVRTVMSAPRPSFAPFYLAGQGNKDWSDGSVTLAGRKRYPARHPGGGPARIGEAVSGWLGRHRGNDKAETLSRLQFLEPADPSKPLRFLSEIRVHNVTPAELGGLLWALTFGGDGTKRHLIGRAKTAGAGQARIEVTALRLVSNDAGAVPDIPALLRHFETHMRNSIDNWPQVAPVQELLRSADPAHGAGLAARLDYLDLKAHRKLRQKVYSRDGDPDVSRNNTRKPRLLGLD